MTDTQTIAWSRGEVACAMASLPNEDLAVLLLAREPGVSYRDVARITGMAPDEVLRRLRAGLARMRAALPHA